MKKIHLANWGEFESILRKELGLLSYDDLVVVRNFALVIFSTDGDEIDQLLKVLTTGTDRDATSTFWNKVGFDHDHENDPKGKSPEEIVYAFTVDLSQTPYLVHHDEPKVFNITDGLTGNDGIVVYDIYDIRALKRVTKNEYWFETSPKEAALLIFTSDE